MTNRLDKLVKVVGRQDKDNKYKWYFTDEEKDQINKNAEICIAELTERVAQAETKDYLTKFQETLRNNNKEQQ